MNSHSLMEKIISLAARRGFIFPSSEIYGGLGGVYDYGPLGVEIKNNIKQLWWKEMVGKEENIVGLDSAILMHPKVWEASGHVESFTDPLVDCKKCKRRFRADHLIEKIKKEEAGVFRAQDMVYLSRLIKKIKCPECGGDLTPPRQFNLLMETFLGVVEDKKRKTYLRGETAQGIYVNFKNVLLSQRMKIPFGIAQIGKAFRNEITPGNFIFRTREFEQMEMQWFCEKKEANKWFKFWQEKRLSWYINLGIKKEHLRLRKHSKDELAHYAKEAVDIEYRFPFGWKEIEGIHNRGDWDLSRHQKFSNKDLSYFDEKKGKKYIPWIIETSGGIDRALLAFLCEAYQEIKGGRTTTTIATKEVEILLKFHYLLSPVKVAVLPLVKKESLITLARQIFNDLKECFVTQYDEVASIGRRYRRQDEIGTPFCVTVDFESLEDKKVTVRDRDTMKQERVLIKELREYLKKKLAHD